jgi:hypothetical protein
MRDRIAMRTRERLCPKLRFNVMGSHGLNPSTDHFEIWHRISQRHTPIDEIAVCNDDELSSLDRRLANAYDALNARLNAANKAKLREQQRNWLQQRALCKSDRTCLAWISMEKNPATPGLPQGIHLTRYFGSDSTKGDSTNIGIAKGFM